MSISKTAFSNISANEIKAAKKLRKATKLNKKKKLFFGSDIREKYAEFMMEKMKV